MATSGFARPEESVHYSPLVGYQVVKPFSMEMPRSLSQVVVVSEAEDIAEPNDF